VTPQPNPGRNLSGAENTERKPENPENQVGQGFSPAISAATSGGALAPEVSSSPASTSRTIASETTAVGLLELPETTEETPEPETQEESVPQTIPPTTAAASDDDTDAIRTAVAQALTAGGHATAAVLLEDGKWTIEGSSVRIEVNAKPTMIRITYNAAAEKLIRQALTQAGAPSRFMIVPGEGLTSSNGPAKVRSPQGSIENEARTNPLVVQAQSLFNAEIVTVVDLRT
jgi:DNA polymerase-3 subunit gamma/tau